MKLIVVPNTFNLEEYIVRGAEAFLFGIKDFSTGFDISLSVKDLEEIASKYNNIDIFVSINKNIFNDEIDKVKDLLLALENINIKGILYYDLAILNLHNKLGLKNDLVWNQTHMVTNYNTCNYYYSEGVKYALLASEITLDEILEIKQKSKVIPLVNLLGHEVMAHSRRSLVTNYLHHINKQREEVYYKLTEPIKDEDYYITEDNTGTTIYDGKIMNGVDTLSTLLKNDFPYGILNETLIPHNIFLDLLGKYHDIINNKDVSSNTLEVKKLIGNYQNFFYKKTIYQVKKNEK